MRISLTCQDEDANWHPTLYCPSFLPWLPAVDRHDLSHIVFVEFQMIFPVQDAPVLIAGSYVPTPHEQTAIISMKDSKSLHPTEPAWSVVFLVSNRWFSLQGWFVTLLTIIQVMSNLWYNPRYMHSHVIYLEDHLGFFQFNYNRTSSKDHLF